MPRYSLIRAGWSHCVPVSMLATGIWSPRSLYWDHTCGALIRWMFHSMVWMPALGAGDPSMMWVVQLGTIFSTSGRAATAARVLEPEVMRRALMIQKDVYRTPWDLSRARSSPWLFLAAPVR